MLGLVTQPEEVTCGARLVAVGTVMLWGLQRAVATQRAERAERDPHERGEWEQPAGTVGTQLATALS